MHPGVSDSRSTLQPLPSRKCPHQPPKNDETGSRQHEAALPGTIFKASAALSASLRTRGSAEVRVMET